MKEFMDALPSGSPTMRRLVKCATIAFRIKPDEIMGGDRSKKVVSARYAVFYLLYHKRGFSTCRIGRMMGRDHSTIHHALNRVASRLSNNDAFWKRVQETWEMACADRDAIAAAEAEHDKRQVEAAMKVELVEVKASIARMPQADESTSRSFGAWSRKKLQAMDRAFQLALTIEGDGMTYAGEEMREAA